MLDVLKLLGLSEHLAYSTLCEEGGRDPQVGPFLEEDAFDLTALESAADGGRQDAEAGRQHEQQDHPRVLQRVARHVEQSYFKPDRRHAAESGEYDKQQLGGHHGYESPGWNGQEIASHREAQRDESGDKQGLNCQACVSSPSVVPVAFRSPICGEDCDGSRTRQQPVQRLAAAFAPVDPNDRGDDRRRHEQVDDAVGLAADVADDHGEEPHEHERHDNKEEDGRDEEDFVHLGLLEEAAVYELSPLLELPVDQAAEDEDADVEVESLEEGQSQRARGLEPAKEDASLSAEHVGNHKNYQAEQADR